MRQKKSTTGPVVTNPRDAEIARIRKVPRGERSDEQKTRLRELQAEVGRERFRRTAPARLQKAEHAIDRLIPLGGKQTYSSHQSERDHILGKLQAALDRVTAAYSDDDANGFADAPFPFADDDGALPADSE